MRESQGTCRNLKEKTFTIDFCEPIWPNTCCRNIDHDDQRVDAFKNIFCCYGRSVHTDRPIFLFPISERNAYRIQCNFHWTRNRSSVSPPSMLHITQ